MRYAARCGRDAMPMDFLLRVPIRIASMEDNKREALRLLSGSAGAGTDLVYRNLVDYLETFEPNKRGGGTPFQMPVRSVGNA